MISLLVSVLVVALLVAFAVWIIGLLPIPQPFKNIVTAIVALLIVLFYFGDGGHLYLRSHVRF